MRLTQSEMDRLLIFLLAELARRHRANGLRLNHPEAVALICDEMHQAARGGASYEKVLEVGSSVLTEVDVLEGVTQLVGTIRLECTFDDGTRLLQVEQPIQPVGRSPAAQTT